MWIYGSTNPGIFVSLLSLCDVDVYCMSVCVLYAERNIDIGPSIAVPSTKMQVLYSNRPCRNTIQMKRKNIYRFGQIYSR